MDVLRPRRDGTVSVPAVPAAAVPAATAAAERHAGDELDHGREDADGADEGTDGAGTRAVVAPPDEGLAGGDDARQDGGVREHHGEEQEQDSVEAGDGSQVVRQDPHEGVRGPPAVGQQVAQAVPGVDERGVDPPEDVLVPAEGRNDRHAGVHHPPGDEDLRRGDRLHRLDRVPHHAPEDTEQGPGQPEREGEDHPLEPVWSEDHLVEEAGLVVVATVAVGSGVGGGVGIRVSGSGRGHRTLGERVELRGVGPKSEHKSIAKKCHFVNGKTTKIPPILAVFCVDYLLRAPVPCGPLRPVLSWWLGERLLHFRR